MPKFNKIWQIIRIQQMLKQWRQKSTTKALSVSSSPSPDVPAGYVAIYVGANGRRFVVRAKYLNHPIFNTILSLAEEEYGFKNDGPLRIPCEEWEFEEILRFVSRSDHSKFMNVDDEERCGYSCIHTGKEELVPQSRPLLRG
ncbi:Auxin-responsive protein SAUR50 [Linum perenne]